MAIDYAPQISLSAGQIVTVTDPSDSSSKRVRVPAFVQIDAGGNIVVPSGGGGGGGNTSQTATANPPTYTEGSTTNPLSSDLTGYTRVVVKSAGNKGAASPATAIQTAGTDGTNLYAFSVDTSGRQNVNIASALPAGANVIGSIANTSFGISGSLPAGTNSIGAVTSTQLPASLGVKPAAQSLPTTTSADAGTDRSISASTTSQTLMVANATRRKFYIENATSINVWVNLGATAVASAGGGNKLIAANGGYWEFEGSASAINVIAASGTPAITAREF